MEENTDGVLNFLDIKVNNVNGLTTSVYHKPTFTGLLTNFRSFVPYEFKTRLVYTLIDRIFKINNKKENFDNDIVKFCKYMSRNMFPKRFVERHIKKYLDKKASGEKKKENVSDIHFFKLPYIGEFSGTVKCRIMKLYKRFCKPEKEIQIVYSISKIRDYFSTKDLVPECFRSYVIYEFKCANCGIRYVGRTHKHFDIRIKEHFGSKSSSIFKHLNDPNNKICKNKTNKENSFKILDSAKTDYELSLKEGLYINWLKPPLNIQKSHEVITLSL